MIAIGIVISILLIIFTPIYLKIYFYADVKNRKVFFACYFFHYIKIISGYAEVDASGITVHVGRKTAFMVEFSQLIDTGKKFSKIKSIEFFKTNACLNISINNLFAKIIITSISDITEIIVKSINEQYKPFRELNILTKFNDTENFITAIMSFDVCFNVYSVLTIAIKKILENTVYAKKQ